ncbi:Hypothetical_protein [Hexamita inflata]|uniref:Hypothetical_protein n=1 Tax=Hexamita inflata TaxID=28002 RepID=A0AA86NEG8_9EUKA|nr:Hypothetical protein HINF_LOCUS5284 [Hexamita inflata]
MFQIAKATSTALWSDGRYFANSSRNGVAGVRNSAPDMNNTDLPAQNHTGRYLCKSQNISKCVSLLSNIFKMRQLTENRQLIQKSRFSTPKFRQQYYQTE